MRFIFHPFLYIFEVIWFKFVASLSSCNLGHVPHPLICQIRWDPVDAIQGSSSPKEFNFQEEIKQIQSSPFIEQTNPG
jgi:hypothetical protein